MNPRNNMLITKDFIIINNPKTGSSFIRKSVKNIYNHRRRKYSIAKKISIRLGLIKPEFLELRLPNVKISNRLEFKDQHGTVAQIPEKYLKNRKIVSAVRNPYSRFLSAYEFESWARAPSIEISILKKEFSNFPNLTLDEYVDLSRLISKSRRSLVPKDLSDQNLGNLTLQFIQMFFDNPSDIIANLSDDYIYSGEYKKGLRPITFLKQENLKEELSNYLSQFDFSQQELISIKNHKRVNVTPVKSSDRNTLWTTKALDYIQQDERLLFKILEDLGINYSIPESVS